MLVDRFEIYFGQVGAEVEVLEEEELDDEELDEELEELESVVLVESVEVEVEVEVDVVSLQRAPLVMEHCPFLQYGNSPLQVETVPMLKG
ncbi:hypothetical protein HF086_012936 [Spodoptera exigua]|uniref:Uncharacterized protein n=1 Tax=Spodoptera exigua TaxID=7107 RepID=A0A922MLP6_SPOEX|nr:hypothetical protein HF086_012936 [Spodoptera exigua]